MGGGTGGNEKARIDAMKASDYQRQQEKEIEEARQLKVRDGQNRIDHTLSSFDEEYYKGVEKDFNDYYRPQIDEQYSDASSQTLYALADAGNLNSSAASELFGDLQEEYGQSIVDVSNRAVDAASNKRAEVANTKGELYAQVQASADPEAAAQVAASKRDVLSQPTSYSALGELFSSVLDRVTERVDGNRKRQQYDQLNDLLYSNKSSAVNR